MAKTSDGQAPPRPLPAVEIARLHLARIVESSDDAIVSKDLDGIVSSWNAGAERLFGYTADEMIGRSIRTIIPAERQSEEDFVLSRIRAGQSVRHYETMRLCKDGTLIPISLTVSPLFDDEGTVVGASKIARDISDRVEADLAARRLAAVVESSDDAIITKGLDSTILSWNAAAERMFGYTADEAIGQSIRMIIPEGLQSEEDAVLARVRQREIVDHYETRRMRKDGTDVVISLTVSPIIDASGAVVGASKIARDVTERARLIAAVKEQAAVTAKLNDVGALVASSLDRTAIIQRVTDLATALTGAAFGAFFYNVVNRESGESYMLYTLSGVAKEAFAQFPQPRATSVFAPTFHGERVVRLDDVTKDSRYGHNAPYHGMPEGHLPVRSYLAVPVKATSGDVLGGLFFGHPQPGVFSEQHEQFAIGVAVWASVALENARLYLDARDADRLKDEFLAVLSHELRTPLNAIVGYARLLRGGIITGQKADRGLEALERNANALTQIVEDVLDVSRIVSGKMRLDLQPVKLGVVVHNAVATVQPAADAKGVRLEIVVDPGAGAVSGDADRLQQVIWNLLANAVKFTPRGGTVQVRVEQTAGHVEVVVNDSGMGIPADFLPYVFERFRQADAGPTRNAGGLGLGLSIVQHIVEMHGGSVKAESPGANRGSTFRVRLPLAPEAAIPARVPGERPPAEAATLRKGRVLDGVRVLVFDDEEDALALVRAVLEAAGADVIGESEASNALARIAAERPHVLVVDLDMPGVTGFELITTIRESPDAAVRQTPAAALAASTRADNRVRALRSGFEAHLAKPVDPTELVASIALLTRRA